MEKEIISRFADAISRLKDDKVIRGMKTISDMYDINRALMVMACKYPEKHSGSFHVDWLAYLVRDFKVNPHFLLLGEQPFYLSGWDANSVRSHILLIRDKKQAC